MEVQITYSGGDFTDTNDKFTLYEPRDIDAFDFFPVFANDKKQLLFLCPLLRIWLSYSFLNHIYDFHIFTFINWSLDGFIMNQQSDQLPVGSLGQLIEHCTGIAGGHGFISRIGVLISLEALIDKNNWNEGTKLDLYGICSLWPRFSLPCPIRDVCIGVGFAKKIYYNFPGTKEGHKERLDC